MDHPHRFAHRPARTRRLGVTVALVIAAGSVCGRVEGEVWTDINAPDIPADIKVQGEYVGEMQDGSKLGCQVIALGGGAFQAVIYPGGLPGDGWDGENKTLMDGRSDGARTTFRPTRGERRYLARSPERFSATSTFPPAGQEPMKAIVSSDTMAGRTDDGGSFELKKVVRESKTLGLEPPEGALLLFDGSSKEAFEGGRLDEETRLLNTDGRDIVTKQEFGSYTLHLEFMLPFRPEARGQGRGNSGVYHVGMYETQVLDSFGLEGKDNECAGIYQQASPPVNMCYPPLTWQTYDVEFTLAQTDDSGNKTENAVITLRHNGVVVHDQQELQGPTAGGRGGKEGTPGAIKLQGHGNPLQYRNIWIVERD